MTPDIAVVLTAIIATLATLEPDPPGLGTFVLAWLLGVLMGVGLLWFLGESEDGHESD